MVSVRGKEEKEYQLHRELVNRCGDWDSPSVDWALQLCVCEELQLEGTGGAAHRAQGAIWLPEGRSFHSCSCVSRDSEWLSELGDDKAGVGQRYGNKRTTQLEASDAGKG